MFNFNLRHNLGYTVCCCDMYMYGVQYSVPWVGSWKIVHDFKVSYDAVQAQAQASSDRKGR